LVWRAAHALARRRAVALLRDSRVRACRELSASEKYRHRYRNDPEFQLRERLRRQFRKKAEAVPGLDEVIRGALKGGLKSLKVEALLGYSIADLKAHLERQFARGMSWSGHGKRGWHIDHILPRKCFDLTTIEGAQAFWSLSNLRPLAARKNLEKRDKVLFLL
jgi:5-methylcytosine-specific restriction endonuclease McrA